MELDCVPCLIGAVFNASGNGAPALAGPSKGAADCQNSVPCAADARCLLPQYHRPCNAPALCVQIYVALRWQGRFNPLHDAGRYVNADMRRTARLRGLPFRSMPVNSRAVRGSAEPYFKSLPALRMLSAIRLNEVHP